MSSPCIRVCPIGSRLDWGDQLGVERLRTRSTSLAPLVAQTLPGSSHGITAVRAFDQEFFTNSLREGFLLGAHRHSISHFFCEETRCHERKSDVPQTCRKRAVSGILCEYRVSEDTTQCNIITERTDEMRVLAFNSVWIILNSV